MKHEMVIESRTNLEMAIKTQAIWRCRQKDLTQNQKKKNLKKVNILVLMLYNVESSKHEMQESSIHMKIVSLEFLKKQ